MVQPFTELSARLFTCIISKLHDTGKTRETVERSVVAMDLGGREAGMNRWSMGDFRKAKPFGPGMVDVADFSKFVKLIKSEPYWKLWAFTNLLTLLHESQQIEHTPAKC